MKRMFWLVFLAIAILISQSNAQLLRSYGVKLAYTSASQSFDYPHPPWPGFGPDLRRREGLCGGIYAEWLNMPFVSIVTELDYVQRGMGQLLWVTMNDPRPLYSVIRENRLDYLSFPFLFRGTLPNGALSPYVFFGPRIDILLSYRDEAISGKSIYEDFKTTIWGGSAGVGVQLDTGLPEAFLLEFRYNSDFVNSYDTDLLKVSNNAFDIWLGVAF